MTTYCIDLDGTLCHTTGEDYEGAMPNHDAIAKVNALHADGCRVVIDTARGSGSGINWRPLTKRQLALWGVKYHELRTGVKVPADVYVDDRAINAEDWLNGSGDTEKELDRRWRELVN